MVRLEYNTYSDNDSSSWIPTNLRIIGSFSTSSSDNFYSNWFYNEMPMYEAYILSIYSNLMMISGSNMGPATTLQAFTAVVIKLIGAITFAIMFGNIALLIAKMNHNSTLYQNKLEDLEIKLKINKVPEMMQVQVNEFFEYCWKQNLIFKNYRDFSDLSVPLQRDIALHLHKEHVYNVPLFCELESIEIFTIIQKLTLNIYMPGDKIIREGERGTEMFFLTEGMAEVVVNKKPTIDSPFPKPLKILLKKGSYFGEIALISNSRRTSDVNAISFCLAETLSRTDYLSLQEEFPDIGPRLKAGLKHYKNNHGSNILRVLTSVSLFKGLSENELLEIIVDYFDEVFVDPHRLLLKPKKKSNALYVVMLGSIKVYADTLETRSYLKKVLAFEHSKENGSKNKDKMEEVANLECVDDQIVFSAKEEILVDKNNKLILNDLRTISVGEFFGNLSFRGFSLENDFYFISETAVQLGVLSKATIDKMKFENPELYSKLKKYYLENSASGVNREGFSPSSKGNSANEEKEMGNQFQKSKVMKKMALQRSQTLKKMRPISSFGKNQ